MGRWGRLKQSDKSSHIIPRARACCRSNCSLQLIGTRSCNGTWRCSVTEGNMDAGHCVRVWMSTLVGRTIPGTSSSDQSIFYGAPVHHNVLPAMPIANEAGSNGRCIGLNDQTRQSPPGRLVVGYLKAAGGMGVGHSGAKSCEWYRIGTVLVEMLQNRRRSLRSLLARLLSFRVLCDCWLASHSFSSFGVRKMFNTIVACFWWSWMIKTCRSSRTRPR